MTKKTPRIGEISFQHFLIFSLFARLQKKVENNGPDSYRDEPLTSIRYKLHKIFSLLRVRKKNVENNGVEPLTSCVQGRRSSQLS